MLTELLTALNVADPSHALPFAAVLKIQWQDGEETVSVLLTYADLILDLIVHTASLDAVSEISLHLASTDECCICFIRDDNGQWVRS